MGVVGERLDHVRTGVHELAVQPGDEVGVLEHDLGHVRARLQVAAPLELEQVSLGADHWPRVQPFEQPLRGGVRTQLTVSLRCRCVRRLAGVQLRPPVGEDVVAQPERLVPGDAQVAGRLAAAPPRGPDRQACFPPGRRSRWPGPTRCPRSLAGAVGLGDEHAVDVRRREREHELDRERARSAGRSPASSSAPRSPRRRRARERASPPGRRRRNRSPSQPCRRVVDHRRGLGAGEEDQLLAVPQMRLAIHARTPRAVDDRGAVARPALAIELAEAADDGDARLAGELAPAGQRRAVGRLAELARLGLVGERIAGRAQLRQDDEVGARVGGRPRSRRRRARDCARRRRTPGASCAHATLIVSGCVSLIANSRWFYGNYLA